MSQAVAARPWLPTTVADRVRDVSSSALTGGALQAEIERLVGREPPHPRRHLPQPQPGDERDEPAGRGPALGEPRVPAVAGLPGREVRDRPRGDRADRGARRGRWPAEVFGARYAEVRVGSGALANLYAFMATCRPGDTIIAPPADHRRPRHPPRAGAAGLYGLTTVDAPVDADGYTVDVDALRTLAQRDATAADHHRRQPQPVPPPRRRDPGDRRRGGRPGPLRRRAPVRHVRREERGRTRSPRVRT